MEFSSGLSWAFLTTLDGYHLQCLTQVATPVLDCTAGLCPLVAGETDIDQLGRVIATFGSIEDAWPGVTQLPDYGKISFNHAKGFPLEELLPDASAGSVKLLGRLLQLDPGEQHDVATTASRVSDASCVCCASRVE